MDASGHSYPVTVIGDIISGVAIVGTIIGYLPFVAAFAGLCWYIIQIIESRTVQTWYQARATSKRTQKIAKLRAKHKLIEAKINALTPPA